MTPKEKAEELVDNYNGLAHSDFHMQTGYDESQRFENAKQCALIAVDEIIESYKTKNLIYPKEIIYYEEVKQEIKKL